MIAFIWNVQNKSTETENKCKFMDAWGWEWGTWGMTENVLKLRWSDGCTTLWIDWKPLNCMLSMGELHVCVNYSSTRAFKALQENMLLFFFQLQAQLQLSAMMMTLPAHSTTSPMGVTPHHLQRAAPMPSLLEWPRFLSLKIPSTLASPTVSSSQTHVSTAVYTYFYTYWPVCCIAISISVFIRAPDKDDWGEGAVKWLRIGGALGRWNRSFSLLLMEFSGRVSCRAWDCGQISTSLGIHFPKPFVTMKLESRHACLEKDRDRNQRYQ